jgi:hypothetical protein
MLLLGRTMLDFRSQMCLIGRPGIYMSLAALNAAIGPSAALDTTSQYVTRGPDAVPLGSGSSHWLPRPLYMHALQAQAAQPVLKLLSQASRDAAQQFNVLTIPSHSASHSSLGWQERDAVDLMPINRDDIMAAVDDMVDDDNSNALLGALTSLLPLHTQLLHIICELQWDGHHLLVAGHPCAECNGTYVCTGKVNGAPYGKNAATGRVLFRRNDKWMISDSIADATSESCITFIDSDVGSVPEGERSWMLFSDPPSSDDGAIGEWQATDQTVSVSRQRVNEVRAPVVLSFVRVDVCFSYQLLSLSHSLALSLLM